MTASVEKPPLILALLLLVAGLAALATAVLLIWARFDVRVPGAPVPAITAPAPDPVASPAPLPGPGSAAPAVTAGSAASPTPSPEPAVADAGAPAEPAGAAPGAAAGGGGWRLALDPKTYTPNAAGETAIAEIAAFLAGNGEAKIRLLGVNDNRLSEKRALQGARTVRDRLVAAGVDRRRCEVASAQEPGLEGLEVRVEAKGGAR